MEWQIALRPGQRRKLDHESEEALAEQRKASVRVKVEHPFLKVKGCSATPKYATGLWRRTGSVWRCF